MTRTQTGLLGAVEHELCGRPDCCDERFGEDDAVEDHVHVEDRSDVEAAHRVGVGDGSGGQQVGSHVVGDCQHHGVRFDAGVVGVDPPAIAGQLADGAHGRVHADVVLGEDSGRRIAVQAAERHARDADVARVGLTQQAVLKNHGTKGKRDLCRGSVEGRDGEHVEQPRDRGIGLTVRLKPVAEGLQVGRWGVSVDEVQSERRHNRAHALHRCEQPVGEQCTRKMEGSGQPVATQPCVFAGVGVDHGDVEAWLHHRQFFDIKPAKEFAIRGATPQEHMLAVVDEDVAAVECTRERMCRAAEPRPGLEECHRPAGVGGRYRRAQAGDSAADDDERRLASSHRRLFVMLRAAR